MTVPTTLEDALETIEDIKADNAKFRRKNRELTAQLEEIGDAPAQVAGFKTKIAELETKLSEAEGYKVKFEEIEGKYNEVSAAAKAAERDKKLIPLLNKLGVTDEKALALAIREMGDVEESGYDAATKKVVTDNPFLASGSKVIPNTGPTKERLQDAPTGTSDLTKSGIAEHISALQNK